MALVDRTYFVGELDIPRAGDTNVNARLQKFIDKYEAKFLKLLLGDLYADYSAGVAADPIVAPWDTLKAKLPDLVAAYVYFHWMRDAAQQNTGIGVVETKAENATVVSGNWKMIRAWNEMAEGIADLYDYLDANTALYTSWKPAYRYSDYQTFWPNVRYPFHFAPINAFNL